MLRVNWDMISLENSYSDIPLLPFTYNNKNFYAVLDTGCESTLVDSKFAEEEGVPVREEDVATILIGANGELGDSFSRTAKLDIKLGNSLIHKDTSSITVGGLLSDLSPVQQHYDRCSNENIRVPVVLGSDTLKLLEADIDYKLNTLRINDISCQR